MEIPNAVRLQIENTERMSSAFLAAILFVAKDSSRDIGYFNNHLLSYLAHDYIQSIVALPVLAKEGCLNACRRELRFILEMSIKLCNIQQHHTELPISVKLDSLRSILDSTNISMQRRINLNLLPKEIHESFYIDVGKFYGETSNYTHITKEQVLERIAMVESGRTSGFESAEDVEELNALIARGITLALVFLFHSVPEYAVGDWFVRVDGGSLNWYYSSFKYIAYIDEHFDYKHERQSQISVIKKARWGAVRF